MEYKTLYRKDPELASSKRGRKGLAAALSHSHSRFKKSCSNVRTTITVFHPKTGTSKRRARTQDPAFQARPKSHGHTHTCPHKRLVPVDRLPTLAEQEVESFRVMHSEARRVNVFLGEPQRDCWNTIDGAYTNSNKPQSPPHISTSTQTSRT